jgi:hypothetical protein
MFGCFKILSAIPGFFVSALLVMWLWRWMAPDFGWELINYGQAMKFTFLLWIAVAPLAAVTTRQEWVLGRWHRQPPQF